MSRTPDLPPTVIRSADGPIVDALSHPAIGRNINGPCVLRAPDWLPDPPGRFLMYFAHHTGTFIRLATSDHLRGPWRVLDTQPLRLADTNFAQQDVTHCSDTGELLREPAHIASPDVHVLDDERKFVMLFHGLHADGTQATRIAVSEDGLAFTTRGYDHDIAPPYLRLCRVGARIICVAWGGEIYISDSIFGPFRKGPPVTERPNGANLIPRHPALTLRNGQLHCFYSLIGDCPEKLWHIPLHPSEEDKEWQAGEPKVVLEPARTWEGAALPKTTSRVGAATGLEHALRDPFVFEDHLFYVGGGESCIAVAEINWRAAKSES